MFPSHREISERAYAAWVSNGQPAGTWAGDWLEAEAELTLVLRSGQARQLMQKAPPEASQLLQAILENSTAVVYVKDLQGRYLLISRRYETLFGVSQEQLAGRTDYDVFPAEVADAVRANDSRVLAARTPLEFEEVVPHGDVMHTYISLKFPISGPSGAPFAVCGISTDITSRKLAEFRLLAEHAVTRALAQSFTLAGRPAGPSGGLRVFRLGGGPILGRGSAGEPAALRGDVAPPGDRHPRLRSTQPGDSALPGRGAARPRLG